MRSASGHPFGFACEEHDVHLVVKKFEQGGRRTASLGKPAPATRQQLGSAHQNAHYH